MYKTFSIAFAGLFLCAAFARGQNNTPNGKALFLKHGCARCHGTDGQGGAGARIAPNPPALAAFIAYVRKPAGTMPPYMNQLTDAELGDIRAYLASVPAPPPVKDIPLLNQ